MCTSPLKHLTQAMSLTLACAYRHRRCLRVCAENNCFKALYLNTKAYMYFVECVQSSALVGIYVPLYQAKHNDWSCWVAVLHSLQQYST